MAYIRLLSKFVDAAYDCNNVLNGSAFVNQCGTCMGGNTGLEDDPACQLTATRQPDDYPGLTLYPNPAGEMISIGGLSPVSHLIRIFDVTGKLLRATRLSTGEHTLSLEQLSSGLYWIRIDGGAGYTAVRKVVKM